MTRHRAKCCCGECVEIGAMCITEDQQDLQRGCYENVTAAEAENDNGIWLGAGTTCDDTTGVGCPDCSDNATTGFVHKKCCYQARIKTGCNEWEIDECAQWQTAITTECECDALMGEWGTNRCSCPNGNAGCTGCCPPASLPEGTTGAIQVIVGFTFRDDYVFNWAGCTGTCGDCECTVLQEHYFENPVYMQASEYASYLSTYQNSDYDNQCDAPNDCGGQACIASYHESRVTNIVAVYTSDCDCGDDDPRCGMCVCEQHFYYSEDGALDCYCNNGHYDDSGQGYTCCDDTPQGA